MSSEYIPVPVLPSGALDPSSAASRLLATFLGGRRAETIKAYHEVALEITMIKGLTEDAVRRLASLKTQIAERFDTLNHQITDTKQDILDLNHQITDTKQDILDLHTKFDEQRNLLLQVLAHLPEKP